uniref:Uncharacterized protein n=1 Tax=Arundo donax TaxID=35708 RepID=A0A0A9EN60_ARUDO
MYEQVKRISCLLKVICLKAALCMSKFNSEVECVDVLNSARIALYMSEGDKICQVPWIVQGVRTPLI